MRFRRPAGTAASSSRSRSTRSPSAGGAWHAPTASSSSSPAPCPGDRVRAEVTKAKKRFAEARTVELLRPGAERIADRCVHGGEPCPGAPWQGLPYERQLDHKRDQVDEALRRIGGLDGFELEEIEPAVEQWRYRNKLEYSFGETRRRADPRLPRPRPLGPGRRRRGLPARLRGAATPPATRSATGRGWSRSPPTTGRARRGVLRNLVVREGRRTGQIQTRLVTSPARFPKPPVDLHTVDRGRLGRHRRADRRARRGAPARGALRAEAGDVPRRLLPDQHRDGRAPLRGRRRVRRA